MDVSVGRLVRDRRTVTAVDVNCGSVEGSERAFVERELWHNVRYEQNTWYSGGPSG